mmetsp:Transcript_13735/g.27597  ORF Transcript_13735/g.27597 Transcript_13735/m.27597 type:complete len:105 (+) Transcript_13735:703-1017(+)
MSPALYGSVAIAVPLPRASATTTRRYTCAKPATNAASISTTKKKQTTTPWKASFVLEVPNAPTPNPKKTIFTPTGLLLPASKYCISAVSIALQKNLLWTSIRGE